MQQTNDINVIGTLPLTTPKVLKENLPMTEKANKTVITARKIVQAILDGKDKRKLLIIGPCSIHDPQIALDYADLVNELKPQVEDQLYLIMRVYFEKPRTTVGWKGLINDPDLNGEGNIEKGLALGRKLLIDINEKGVPAAGEMLDPITPQYLAGLISWGAIGARTTESQIHREMASGLSMPVGFKNGTNGGLTVALNAMASALHPHRFIGVDPESRAAIIQTRGNSYGHLVLRGGDDKPNYDAESIKIAEDALSDADLRSAIMVDCNHANSNKDPYRQEGVLQNITQQILDGNQSIIGAMIESNLKGGRQDYHPNTSLEYGVSITDACLDWDNTERSLIEMANQLRNTSSS